MLMAMLTLFVPSPSPVVSNSQRNSCGVSSPYIGPPTLLLDLCNIAKGLMTLVMGVLVQILEQTWRFGNLFLLEASCMLPYWTLSSRSSRLLSLIFAVGIILQTLAEGGASCSFLWAFARFSQVLAVTTHRLPRVAGAAGRICCLLSLFSPKVTRATTKSPLHWDEWKTPKLSWRCEVGTQDLRDTHFNSGISCFATFHCERAGRMSLYGQESGHCPKSLRGGQQQFLACSGTLDSC